MGVGEPGRTGVVEVGEGASGEIGGGEAGRVEPAVAELDEPTSGSGDRLALLGRRAREGEGVSKQVVGV